MGNWGIAETASKKEKLKAKMSDYLGGLNSCSEISYKTYDKLWDFSMKLLDKIYDLGKKEGNKKG